MLIFREEDRFIITDVWNYDKGTFFFNKGTYFFKQSYIYTKGKFWGKSPAVASISKLTKRPHLLFDRHDWSYLSVMWKECCPVHPWESSIWALLHHRFSRKIHHQRIPFKSLLTYIPHICHFFYTGRIFENQILHPKKRHQKH